MKDLERDTPSRLTFLAGMNRLPVWTPDGKNIVFRSENSPAPGLYWIRSDGSGEAQRLTDGKLDEFPCSLSPDGKRLAFNGNANGGSQDIFTAPIEGDPDHMRLGKPELFLCPERARTPLLASRAIAPTDPNNPIEEYARGGSDDDRNNRCGHDGAHLFDQLSLGWHLGSIVVP